MNEHPDRGDLELERWRLIKQGGDAFVSEFLVKKEYETSVDFAARTLITPDPCTASSAIDDLINTFSARLDVTRSGGSQEFQQVISGRLGGVDRQGTDMQTFIIRDSLPELCYMSMHGWLIHNFEEGDQDEFKTPYIIPYRAEDIYNWAYVNNKLVAVALRSDAAIIDEDGFSTDSVEVFRVFKLVDGKVVTHLENTEGIQVDPVTLQPASSEQTLNLDEIPFVFVRLPVPLLQRIDKYQIAVLNLQSADIDWLSTGNMTIYVEQTPLHNNLPQVKKPDDPTAEPIVNQVVIGNKVGRSYAMNAKAPEFIAPPADPIKVSMEKQKDLKDQVKDILKTQLNTMSLASSESIDKLSQGLEAGLFVIGVAYLTAEIKFARIFSKYEGKGEDTSKIAYPTKYELRTEEARLNKAVELKKIQKSVGSNIAKQHLEVQVIQTLLEGRIPSDQYDAAIAEIMDDTFVIYDAETVINLTEQGIISRALASGAMGAPEVDVKTAMDEHLERIKAVQLSQTVGSGAAAEPALQEKVRKEADALPDNGSS